MATTRIKEKISRIVSSQLPEFIQSDYSTFVSFIEAYYKFLEQDQEAFELIQNARSYNDLDLTAESFVVYFLNTYAKNIPLTTELDKRLLIKKIKDLYESKGSELSFKYLFNLLFKTEVNITYPYENILRSSAGKWSQRNSIKVLTTSGNRNLILNRSLLYTSNGQDFSTPIVEVKYLTNDITEVFLDSSLLASTYTIGEAVTVRDANGIIFSGNIDTTLTEYIISNGGIGFKNGQVYSINYSGGFGTLIRVANTSNTGAITEVKFLTYGGNYPNRIFTVDLDPNKTVSETLDAFGDETQGFDSYGFIYKLNTVSDSTQGHGSYGSIVKYDNTSPDRYFLENYNEFPELYTFTDLLASFDDTVFTPVVDTFNTLREAVATFTDNVFSAAVETTEAKPPGYATIQFNPGALGRYPGSYLTNENFISELDVRLENDVFYQPFAYLTNTELDISKFFDIITQLIHPAGQRLFNNRILTTSIDLNSNVYVDVEANIFEEALSVFDALDNYTYNLARLNVDLVSTEESNSYNLTKVINDTSNTEETSSFLMNLVYNDSVTPIESINFDFATFAEHNTATDSLPTATINKSVLNISNVSLSESAIGTVQGYFSESYVAENYTGFAFTLV